VVIIRQRRVTVTARTNADAVNRAIASVRPDNRWNADARIVPLRHPNPLMRTVDITLTLVKE
jgi:hypothetical protein